MRPEPAARARAAVAQGGLFTLALCWLQGEKALAAAARGGAATSAGELALAMAGELGFGLAWAGAWALVGRSGWLGRAWSPLFLGAHLAAYAVLVLDHQFFLLTGTRSSVELLIFAGARVAKLWQLFTEATDASLLLRFALLPLWVTLGAWLSERVRGPAPGGRGAAGLTAAGVALIFTGSMEEGSSLFVELVRGNPRLREERARFRPELVAPIYRAPAPARSSLAAPPDVLIVVLESFRADLMPPASGAEGRALTPALTALAEQSLQVAHAYAAVPHTSKALVALHCGMYPRLTMAIWESRPGGLPMPCLPTLLGAAGYRSAFFQTADGAFEDREALLENLGFDVRITAGDLPAGGFERVGYLGVDEFAMLEPALDWLEGGDAPALLTLLTLSTHHPYRAPGQPPAAGLAQERAAYDAAVRHVDAFVGAVVDTLRERGRLERTALFVLGDHGEAFGEHGRRAHDGVPYDEVMRVPWLLRLPGGQPGAVEGPRQQLDLLPTALEIAGLEPPRGLPGRSLLSAAPAERAIGACFYTRTCLSMREGPLKWVYHYGVEDTELFDLERDPLERVDLAPDQDPARVRAAEERMLGLKFSVDAYYEGAD